MKTVHSRDNPFARHLIALAHSSRERKKSGHTVLDGAHLVDAFIASGRVPLAVAIRESAAGSDDARVLINKIAGRTVDITILADVLIDEASALDSPASIMAIVDTPSAQPIPVDADVVIVLDNVQDPGNVGTILRSAAAFGVHHAVLGKGTAFAWSPKVLRAGQGAHFAINIVEGVDVVKFLGVFGGDSFALVPSQLGATSIMNANFSGPVAMLIGSEGSGLAPNVIAAASHRVTIPMPGETESLNAAVCAAIAMYEMRRQRHA